MRGVGTDRAVELLEGHLDQAQRHILAAIGTVADERVAADLARDADPEAAGAHQAHGDVAHRQWNRALGARAALEAVYRELIGRPSPTAATDAQLLANFDLPENPVGLGDPVGACNATAGATR